MIGYLDCSTGVSGDKLLGALLDIGEQTGAFTAESLTRLVADLAPEARVDVLRTKSHGIPAVGIHVSSSAEPPARHLSDIRAIIARAELSARVQANADLAFTRLAQAEAAVHGCSVEEVHFHEVGAIDTVVDIVGALCAAEALGIERIVASRVAVGSGTVECSHGVLPVPAPATARLLIGIPCETGPATGELTTPTGAVLVSVLAAGFGTCPPLIPRTIGYGAGERDLGLPNVCRLTLGEPDQRVLDLDSDRVVLLETNIDHISPEAAAFALQQLLDEGALDAWIAPIVMKKGRAAMLLSALVADGSAHQLAARVVALTGSLGVRQTRLERFIAPRETRTVDTEFGPVRYKVGPTCARPEHEDVARIARETGMPYGVVADRLAAEPGRPDAS